MPLCTFNANARAQSFVEFCVRLHWRGPGASSVDADVGAPVYTMCVCVFGSTALAHTGCAEIEFLYRACILCAPPRPY